MDEGGMFTVLCTAPISREDYDEIGIGLEHRHGIPVEWRTRLILFGPPGPEDRLEVRNVGDEWLSRVDPKVMAEWTKHLRKRPVAALVCTWKVWRLAYEPIAVHCTWVQYKRHKRAKVGLWDWLNNNWHEYYEVDWESVWRWVQEEHAKQGRGTPGGQRFLSRHQHIVMLLFAQ